METCKLSDLLSQVSYPGRGIVAGKSPNGKYAVTAYFIMGRSVNSRNRVFTATEDGIKTEAFDPSKLSDPHLIIYNAVRMIGTSTIVTNGDQTDTIYDLMSQGQTFDEALMTRIYEDDAPNFTPRISAILYIDGGEFKYEMNTMLYNGGEPNTQPSCDHINYSYSKPENCIGHYIHTYKGDGNPLPSFDTKPEQIETDDDIDSFTSMIWDNLNEDNKVSLFVKYIDIATGESETRIVNKNK